MHHPSKRVATALIAIGLCAGLGGCAAERREQAPSSSIHWRPYSDDVFAQATAQHKLVILDLEAVWCHWCHVQDEVTYADPKVIALIESRYIAVKVDQDARPDLSNRYEDYGWPATIVFNSTGQEIAKRSGYIPPRPMAAMLQAFVDDPRPGPSITAPSTIEFGRASSLSAGLSNELQTKLDSTYDAAHGGWGTIHKYVDWDAVEYSTVRAGAGDPQAEHRARQTLDAGLALIDPVWGGVYQYSVGGDWNQPHFEKLMQFQAELLRTYALAGARWNEPRYTAAAAAIRSYIASFLTAPEGAFDVSQDADLVEGQHSADYFVLDDAHRRKLGIPRVDAHHYARENGWAISCLADEFAQTRNPADLHAALHAAQWIIDHRALSGGGFRHADRDAAGPYLADTLSMGGAFLALYEVTSDRAWLARAVASADFIASRFGPAGAGRTAGFVTALAAPTDPLQPGPQIDENVAAARFFNRLSHYTGRKSDRGQADIAMRYLSTPAIARSRSLGLAGILLADEELMTEPAHVTIVGPKSDPAALALFQEALKAPVSYRRIEWWDRAEGPLMNADVDYPDLPRAAAFVCSGNACSSPLTDPKKLAERLNRK